jgi:hypothetical protein
MKKTLVLFALGAISVAMVVPPQFTARTLTAIHLNSIPYVRTNESLINTSWHSKTTRLKSCMAGESGPQKKKLSPEWQPVRK